MNSLPSSVNFAEPIPSLPEASIKYDVALQPVNGQTFSMGGNQIIFQFPNRGYLDPQSVYLRYKAVIGNATTASNLLGCPFSAPFQRLETQFGSVTVDSINDWNQVNHILTNITMDVAQKYGMQSSYGYTTSPTPTIEELDSRAIPVAGETAYFAGPLPCMLTNIQDKLLPLWAMPTISMVLTTDALANIINPVGTVTGITLSNVELCFSFIEFGPEVDAMVRGMGQRIYVKSQSFSNASVNVASGQNGSTSLIFNQRYASCKAAIVTFNGAINNKKFEAVDITNSSGEYSLNISGIQYPQKPYSALNNKAGILQELRKCVGSIYDKTNNMAINNLEFSAVDNVANALYTLPGKFYLGFNLEKLHSGALLTGISTNNSNITVNITQSTASTVTRTCNLLLVYDSLIEIDLLARQSSVKV
jgi:hypothetical protein